MMGDAINFTTGGMTGMGPVNNGTVQGTEEGVDIQQYQVTSQMTDTEIQQVAAQALSVIANVSMEDLKKQYEGVIKAIVPEIDPAELEDLASDMAELEALVTLLTLQQNEEQAKAVAAKIQTKMEDMERKHAEVIEKIQKSINVAIEQEKAAKKNKILGWIMTALAIIAAAVSIAATVVTGGGSLAIVGCILAGVSALFSLTNQVLDATGAIEKSIDDRAKKICEKDPKKKLSEVKKQLMEEYQIGMMVAQGVLALASIGCSIASLVNVGKAAADLSVGAARALKALRIIGVLGGLAQTGLGVATTVEQWKALFRDLQAGLDSAEIQKLKAYLEKLKGLIEEDQEQLQQLLQMISDSLGVLLEVFTKPIENANLMLDDWPPANA